MLTFSRYCRRIDTLKALYRLVNWGKIVRQLDVTWVLSVSHRKRESSDCQYYDREILSYSI